MAILSKKNDIWKHPIVGRCKPTTNDLFWQSHLVIDSVEWMRMLHLDDNHEPNTSLLICRENKFKSMNYDSNQLLRVVVVVVGQIRESFPRFAHLLELGPVSESADMLQLENCID